MSCSHVWTWLIHIFQGPVRWVRTVLRFTSQVFWKHTTFCGLVGTQQYLLVPCQRLFDILKFKRNSNFVLGVPDESDWTCSIEHAHVRVRVLFICWSAALMREARGGERGWTEMEKYEGGCMIFWIKTKISIKKNVIFISPLTGDVEELYCPAPSTNAAPVMHQNETYHGGMYYPFAAARLANNIQQPRGGFNKKPQVLVF